jgi:hypothetical protein
MAASTLAGAGLDGCSINAILQAVEVVKSTGYGTITITFQKEQVTLWKAEVSGKPER